VKAYINALKDHLSTAVDLKSSNSWIHQDLWG